MESKKISEILFTFLKPLGNHIYLLVFFSLAGSGLGFFYSTLDTDLFKAESKFYVKESAPNMLQSAIGNLGAFMGINSITSTDKTIAIITSDRIVVNALFSKATIMNQSDLLINHFFRLERLSNVSKLKSAAVCNCTFFEEDINLTNLSYSKNKALKYAIESFVGGNGLISTIIDKKSGVISLTTSHTNEKFAIALNRLLIENTVKFLKSQYSESAGLNVNILDRKLDSIETALGRVRRELARQNDNSNGLLYNVDKVGIKNLTQQEFILQNMYAEAQKNMETFLFVRQTSEGTSNLSILSTPFPPLNKIQKSKLLFSVFGFIIGLLIPSLFLLSRNLFHLFF